MKHRHGIIVLNVILQQVLGMLWYSHGLFGGAWLAGIGKTEDQINKSDPMPFLVAIAGSFLLSYVFSWLCQMLRVDSWKQGAALAVNLWIGFVLPLIATHYKFIGYSWPFIAGESAGAFIGLLIAGLLIGGASTRKHASRGIEGT